MVRSSRSATARCLVLLVPLAAAVLIGGSLEAQTGSPDVEVLDGATAVALNGTVGFGTTAAGVARSKTFTVRNTGSAPLLASEAVSVPPGFTVMINMPGVPDALLPTNVPAFTIPPGGSATFTVALNSGAAANYSGNLSFATNVSGKNPYVFRVTGKVVPPPAVRIVDDGAAGFLAESGTWTAGYTEPGAQNYQVTLTRTDATATPGTATATASWTFNGLQPGVYRVSVTHHPFPNWAASNTPFSVYDGATNLTPAPVLVNQQVAAADFVDAARGWKDLGNFTITGSRLVVRVTNDADGQPVADAARIERVGYPGQFLDDSGPGFGPTLGGWNPDYTEPGARDFQGSVTYAEATPTPGTATARARWTFAVAPGTYRVMAASFGYPWAATNTPYRVYDDATLRATVRVNQTVTPTTLTDAGVGWRDLGFFTITSNTLVVEIANDANSWVVADGVRVERVNRPTVESMADTVRFLEQATWGPTPALIDPVRAQGFEAWLNQQFSAAATSYPTLPLFNGNNNVANNNTNSCYGDPTVTGNPARAACIRDHYSMYPLQNRFFSNALYGEDQLRQRMLWALHKIWVISGVDITQPAWVAPYLQILSNNALGNYRALMYEVTLNPAMGNYLDMSGSTRANPNENYPRELLQLFTIGLDELNPDGSRKLSGSVAIPTYDQNGINEITKVFTGWRLAPAPATGIPNYIDPMRLNGAATENPVNHDFTQKTLLRRFVQPARTSSVANAYLDLNEALDNIYAHPNVAPFICKQLIQQLVTSNPSPAYVARVADTFNRNRAAPNQLSLVARAILLDPEARGDRKTADNYGHLKEPVQHITNLMRMFDAQSANRTQGSDGYLNPDAVSQGQDTWRPPSVFSYFSPGRPIPGTSPPVVAPEFGILTTSTVLRRANFINQSFTPNSGRAIDVVRNPGTTPSGVYPPGHPLVGQPLVVTGPLGTAVDVSFLLPLAGDPAALVNELDRLMLHGTMTPEMRSAIVTAVNAVAATNARKRVRTAVYLVATSSQYQVQK